MMRFLKRLLCKHVFYCMRTIHGDEANYARSQWCCVKCGKQVYSPRLNGVK